MSENPEIPLSLLGNALDYAARGWLVLPLYEAIANGSCACGDPACSRVGKHPRTKNGYKDATTDEERINDWWARWPDANVGVCTGPVSGVIVLDIDPRNDGDESLAELEKEFKPLPPTPEVHTGGGGRHMYFSVPTGTEIKKKVLADGVDLQAEGAYVVAPPSRHASGEAYRWIEGRHPSDVPVRAMPEWLLRLATTSSPPESRSLDELLDEAGGLQPNATVSDVETWLHEVSRIAVSPDVSGRAELFRRVAMSRLSKVETIKGGAARVFDEAVSRAEGRARVDEGRTPDGHITDELRVKAIALLEQPHLLHLADTSISKLGLQGEPINRRMVFLAGVSGHLGEPIHLVVHGASAGGKNMLVRTALDLLPPDRVLIVSGMSTHALEFRGGRIEGVLVIDEAEGQRDAEYELRVAMSEGRITRLTVNRDEDGALVGEELEVEVAASIITTTTEPALHEENQTRVFDLWIDDSESLTAEILQAYADRAEGRDPDLTIELRERWHAAMRLLEPARVVIPYALILVESFPTSPLRARRDFQRVIALISACALLYQRQRNRDGLGRVIAEVRDYAAVLPLIQAVLGPTMVGLPDKALELCRLQKKLEEPLAQRWVRRIDLENEAGRRKMASAGTVHKWSKRLRELGFWEGEMERGTWRHRTLRDPEQNAIPLPTKEELEQKLIEKAESPAMSHEPNKDGPYQEAHSDA